MRSAGQQIRVWESMGMRYSHPRIFSIGILAVGGFIAPGALVGITGARASSRGIEGQVAAAGRTAVNAVVWLDAPNSPKTRRDLQLARGNAVRCHGGRCPARSHRRAGALAPRRPAERH